MADKIDSLDLDDFLEQEEALNFGGYQKDALLFCIDTSPEMLSSQKKILNNSSSKRLKLDEKSTKAPLVQILESVYGVLTQKIISTPMDKVGILLFSTRNSFSIIGEPINNIYELMPLDIPNAKSIKHLRSLITSERKFEESIGSSSEFSLSDVFYTASNIFTANATNFASKRLFLVTCNDNPVAKNSNIKKKTLTRGRDLFDLGVIIEPLFISTDNQFQIKNFYEELLFDCSNFHELYQGNFLAKGPLLLQQMQVKLKSRQTSLHAAFESWLEFAPDFRIGVKGYLLYRKQKVMKRHYVYTRGDKAEIVIPETSKDNAKSSEEKEYEPNFNYVAYFDGEALEFSKEEIEAMRNFGDPVIEILGFESINKLRVWENMRPCWAIYPTENKMVGSTRTFAALLRKMLISSLIGIAYFIRRKISAPLVVAMIASPLEIDLNSSIQKSHPVIYLTPLPYAEDIRRNPENLDAKTAPSELIDAMADIIRKLKLNSYEPEKYSNPALQWQFQVLQALALEDNIPLKPVDKTIPDYDWINKKVSEEIQFWKDTLATED